MPMPNRKPTKGEKAAARTAILRRFAMRRQRAESDASAKAERLAGELQVRQLVRSERTGKLATCRIRTCVKFSSAFAVRQLASIGANERLPARERVAAAEQLLRLSGGFTKAKGS